jgi:DNA-binding transcriptional LysR family regulator
MLDSHPLRCFVAVARELHFGRAAEQLQLAQSALSRQIQALERDLGVRLLNRGRRSAITLTEAGMALLGEAQLAIQQLDRAEATARRAARGEIGRLEIGYVVSAALSGVLPRTLERFRALRPDVQVQLVAMETPRQLEALRSGLLDVGFLRPRPTYPAGVRASIVHRDSLLRRGRRRLDYRAVGRKVATQHCDAGAGLKGFGERPDHVPVPAGRIGDILSQRAAVDGQRIDIQMGGDLAQHGRQAAGVVEVFHQVLPGGLEVNQAGQM